MQLLKMLLNNKITRADGIRLREQLDEELGTELGFSGLTESDDRDERNHDH